MCSAARISHRQLFGSITNAICTKCHCAFAQHFWITYSNAAKRFIYSALSLWAFFLKNDFFYFFHLDLFADLLNILDNSKNIRFPVRIYFMGEKLVNLCQKQKGMLTAQICHNKMNQKRNIPQWSDVLTVQLRYCSWLCLQQCNFLIIIDYVHDSKLQQFCSSHTAYWDLSFYLFSPYCLILTLSPVCLRVLGPAVTFRVRPNARNISTSQLARVAGTHKHRHAQTHTYTHTTRSTTAF